MANITNSEWIQQNNARIDAIKTKANTLPDGSVSPNIFVQTIEPTLKKGLWLQTNKTAEHYKSDDSIYFSGNWSNDGDTASVPFQFYHGLAISIGTNVYLFGSQYYDGSYPYEKYAYKYDTLTDTYTQLTNSPRAFYGGAVASVNTDIYLFGGGATNGSQVSYKYDTLTDTYTQITNLPYSLSGGAAVSHGTDIYVFLGRGSSAYKYDTLTNTYTAITSVPFTFYYGCAAIVGTDIYLLGSQSTSNGTQGVRYNYKYNVLTNTWSQLTNIPYDFWCGTTAILGTDIYLLGSSRGSYRQNFKYNTLTDTYTQLTNVPYDFTWGGAVAIGTNIHIFGGSGDKTATRIYHLQTKTYETDNTVIIAQGRASTGKTYNTGYTTELFDTDFDENFKPLYGLVDVWFYTTQDGIILDIPTYYGDGTQWVKFKN